MLSSIFKHCRNGLLYILTVPVIIVLLAIYGIVGIGEFFIVGVRAIYYFFTGRNLFGDLPEDVKAKEILEARKNPQPVEITPINENKEDKPYITNPFDNNDDEVNNEPPAFIDKGEEQ